MLYPAKDYIAWLPITTVMKCCEPTISKQQGLSKKKVICEHFDRGKRGFKKVF